MGGPGGAAFTGGPWYARSADFTGPQAVGTHVSLHDQPCLARSAAFTGYYEAYLVAQDAKAREQFLKSGSGKRFIRRQLEHYLSGSSL